MALADGGHDPVAYAQALIDAGNPVIVCRPNPAWTPNSGPDTPELFIPDGWNTTTPAECDLTRFRPGRDTLAAVTGWLFDVVDVDTKAGGTVNNLPPFRRFGRHRTPSGGHHDYVPTSGLRKIGGLTSSAGFVGDLLAGSATGAGRALDYLPGSTRPAYPGKHYTIEEPIDLDGLADSEPDDNLIACLLADCKGSRGGEAGKTPATAEETTTFREQHNDYGPNPITGKTAECGYGRAAFRTGFLNPKTGEHEPGLLDLVTGAPKGKRHIRFVSAMLRAAELIQAGCGTTADIDALIAALHAVKPEGGTSAAKVLSYAIANSDGDTACTLHRPPDEVKDRYTEKRKKKQATSSNTLSNTSTSSDTLSNTSAPSLPPTVDVTGLWDRPVMRHLYISAQAKRVSPLGALGATLSRVLAMLSPEWQLPGIVIGPGSLNFYTALVGRSGGGKGGPDAVAAAAFHPVSGRADRPIHELDTWRDPISGTPLYTAELGSGEGFGRAYTKWDKQAKEMRQCRSSVLYKSPEIDWLRGVGLRSGSTILPTLRKAWTGEALNPQFATDEKRIRLDDHSYRVCLTVGVQPKRADILLDDADGGLPQRILWMPVTDPHMPDHKPDPPARMRIRIPSPPAPDVHIGLCPQGVAEIDAAALRRGRGEGDDLDTHALFCREKVAAGLALLDGHLGSLGITPEDWELAGLVMKVSDTTRGWVQDVRRDAQAQTNRARGQFEGERELIKRTVTEQAELGRARDTIRKRLQRESTWLTHGQVRAAVRSDIRKWVDDALDVLIAANDVEAERHAYQGQETTRYRSRS